MGKLSGKIALVTGGNGGIGLATAKQFVAKGAYVFISGRRESELAKAVEEIGESSVHPAAHAAGKIPLHTLGKGTRSMCYFGRDISCANDRQSFLATSALRL